MQNFHWANMSILFIVTTQKEWQLSRGFTVLICLFLRHYYRNRKHHWTRPRQLPPVANRLDQQPQRQRNSHQRNNNNQVTARKMVSTPSFVSYLDSVYYRRNAVWEGNVFSHACQSVCSRAVEVHYVPTLDLFKRVQLGSPHPGLFKLLHYVSLTPISKRAAGLRMKGLLVNLKFAHMLDVCIDAGC